MNSITQLIEQLLSIQQEADKRGIEVDVLGMYSAFYESYQLKHRNNPEYLKIMLNANNWVLSQINEEIVNKEAYNKKILHRK